MSDERVRRVQELRRSNAASPRPGRRPAGPDPSEWDEDELPELRDVLAAAIARQQDPPRE